MTPSADGGRSTTASGSSNGGQTSGPAGLPAPLWAGQRPRGRGRDAGYPAPPAQIRAGATNAHGSYLGCASRNSGDCSQSEPQGTDAESQLGVGGSRASPETCPMSSGFSDSAVEAATSTRAALGTMPLYGSPLSFMWDLSLIAFSHRSAFLAVADDNGVSRFSY